MAYNSKKNNWAIFDLPKGQYRLIGWDIDTTGKRLGDEICQVAGYYPASKFSQYILPTKDFNPFIERRYKIGVIDISRQRLLKDLKTSKFLQTKSEIDALTDFIVWLERNKGDSNDGIILVYHEVKRIVPSIFLDALKRYELFDRFTAVVKGFCNIYTVAKMKCTKSLRSFSLKVLSRILLDEEDDLSRSAAIRANAYYTIIQRIRQDEIHDFHSNSKFFGHTSAIQTPLSEFARQYAHSVDAEEKELRYLKVFIECLNSLRPVFKQLICFDLVSRINASRLRCKLAENNIHFNQLQNAWDNGGKNSIIQILKTVSTSRQRDYTDLLKILDCYFDPSKLPVDPNFFKRRKSISNYEEANIEHFENLPIFSELSPNSDEN